MDEASTRNSPATTTTTSNPMPGSDSNSNGNISTTTAMTQHQYIRLSRGTEKLVASNTTQGYSLAQKFLAEKYLEHSRHRRHARGLANIAFISIAAIAALWLWSVSAAKDKDQENKPAVCAHERPDKQGPTEGRRSDA